MVREIVLPSVILFALFAAAVLEDLRTRTIPNAVCAAGFVAGVFWHALGPAGAWAFDPTLPGATGGLGASLAGLAMLVSFFPFYRLGVAGAGDVKLLAAVAACLGASSRHWLHLVGVVLMVLVAGGGLALVRMTYFGLGAAVWRNLCGLLRLPRRSASSATRPRFNLWRDTADRMPYSLAIALGTTLYLVGSWNGYSMTA